MAYIDKKGDLRNSEEDIERFQRYCRERVKKMKNSSRFLKYIDLEYDRRMAEEQ